MANTKDVLPKMMETDGCIGVCLVDAGSGMMMGAAGGDDFDLEVAAATNTEVVRAKQAAIRSLELDDTIEDILISLSTQYHVIRPLKKNGMMFLYTALDRKKANLAMARHNLASLETELEVG